MHPNCRCTTVMAGVDTNTRLAKNPETGENYRLDGNVTFKEWKQNLTPKQKDKISKFVDNGGGSGIIIVGSGKIMNINNIDSPIEQRNTGKGNPSAIIHADRPLNNRQKKLLEELPEYDSQVIVDKKDVSMKDLSAFTAYTGDEFALFTKGHERLVIRGNQYNVNVDENFAKQLNDKGYRWSGHTHPGVIDDFATPSPGDKNILKCFKQEISVIYNSMGHYRTFGKE